MLKPLATILDSSCHIYFNEIDNYRPKVLIFAHILEILNNYTRNNKLNFKTSVQCPELRNIQLPEKI